MTGVRPFAHFLRDSNRMQIQRATIIRIPLLARALSTQRKRAQVTLLYNPKCSKSRQAQKLLANLGLPVKLRPYLEDPLSRPELEDLSKRLRLKPIEFARAGEAAFKSSGLTSASSDAEVLDAIAAHPVLLQRPIALWGNTASICRPPSKIMALFAEEEDDN